MHFYLAQNEMRTRLEPLGASTDWTEVAVYEGNEMIHGTDGFSWDSVYEKFPLFNKNYQLAKTHPQLSQLFDHIFETRKEYREYFANTLNKSDSDRKLVDDTHQLALSEIFGRFINDRRNITPAHYQKLIEIYFLSRKSDKEKAQTLVCLAVLFTQLSTKHHLGVENHSPNVLRAYARALLIKARQLDRSVLPTIKSQEWEEGLDRNECSDLICRAMVKHIHQTQFSHLLDDILPKAWTSLRL